MASPLIYLHPVAGVLAAGSLLWIGSQGFRARHRARYAPAARATHRRWAVYVYSAVVAVAVAGTGSVYLLRQDLTVAGSWHFWIMWGVVLLLTGGALTAGRIGRSPTARRIHPWLGFGALLGALAGAALGLGLLP